jgi:hypothetical protein
VEIPLSIPSISSMKPSYTLSTASNNNTHVLKNNKIQNF